MTRWTAYAAIIAPAVFMVASTTQIGLKPTLLVMAFGGFVGLAIVLTLAAWGNERAKHVSPEEHHRRWIGCLLAALLLVGCGGEGMSPTTPTPAATPAPDLGPPNIILIFADDMGYADVSFNSPRLQTPNIDRIADEGVRLTDFYVPSPICSSSRAALMTGRHPAWVGVPWNPFRPPHPEEVFIAEPLRDAGYFSAAFGKWHLGTEPEHMPTRRGFDAFWGFITGRLTRGWWEDDHPSTNGASFTGIASALTSKTLQFIDTHPKPFFVYLSHRDPHAPHHETYADAVRRLDVSVGQLLEGLEARGLAENTLVFFTSDNGPVPPAGSAAPFDGRKGSCKEGGIRMPTAARWPAQIPAGTESDEIASTLDLFPTFVALAGGQLPQDVHYPGRDITPILTGTVARLAGHGQDGRREVICWQSGGPGAIRSGKWKYLRPSVFFGSTRLFNLEDDPGERINVLSDHPELGEQLDWRMVELSRR